MDPQINQPVLTVIIPVHNNRDQLRACLSALRASSFSHFEILVIDDGSVESTAETAAAYGSRFIRLAHRQGPASARNHGACEARGEYLLFLDSDVCVHPDTLEKIVATFAGDTSVDAVFGSYDARPAVPNLVSQYRNLMHHFTHQTGNEEASTFWAGCGAIRRSVFVAHGGFDTGYNRPSVEDIELGMRLYESGRRIMLNRRVLGTHQKHWTLWNMLKTDIVHRGIPWTRLLLRHGQFPNDLNLKHSQHLATLLAWALMAALAVGSWQHPPLLFGPLLTMLPIAALDRLTHKPAVAVTVEYLVAAGMSGTLIAYGVFFRWWILLPLALALGIVLINRGFYRLMARQRGLPFALFVFPLHVLFYLYSAVALMLGIGQHALGSADGDRRIS